MNKFTIMERLWMWWNNICPVHLAAMYRLDNIELWEMHGIEDDGCWGCSDCWKEADAYKIRKKELEQQERQKRIRKQELAR